MQIAMFEREAVNTVFQGSAADLVKMAMVKVRANLDENARMLLQIHDELIFEVKDEFAEEFGRATQKRWRKFTPLTCHLKHR